MKKEKEGKERPRKKSRSATLMTRTRSSALPKTRCSTPKLSGRRLFRLQVLSLTWRDANVCCHWAVKLDVRDLGGHLDLIQRALAAPLSDRVKEATSQVIAVGAVHMKFQRKILVWWDSIGARVLQFLSLHLVPSDLLWHVQFGPRNSA